MSEKIFSNQEYREREPKIELIPASLAPVEYKKNPFYHPYHWGMADWEEKKLYLPDHSDEAITWAIASHELGHLVDRGRIQPDVKNFAATEAEEQRAWEQGMRYLDKYLVQYYSQEPEMVDALKASRSLISAKMMEMTLLSKPFYEQSEQDAQQQRETFLQTQTGQALKKAVDGLQTFVENEVNKIHEPRLLRKVRWDDFAKIIRQALTDIEADNQ